MTTRREVLGSGARVALLLAATGLIPSLASAQTAGYLGSAFDAKTMKELQAALGMAAPAESKDVTLTAPDIAENGAVVPLAVTVAATGVKRILLLVEKNPAILAGFFDVTDSVEASFGTRVKMGQSSNVFGVAVMGDGRVLFAQKEVKVTLGGCGG